MEASLGDCVMSDLREGLAKALRDSMQSHVSSDNDSSDSYWRKHADAALAYIRQHDGHAEFVRVYNSGYAAGHHDTVEGQYTHILPVDMDTYHADVVGELLAELAKEQP